MSEVIVSILHYREIMMEPNEARLQHEAEIQRIICIQKRAECVYEYECCRLVTFYLHVIITVPEATARMDTQ
jgi:hypothetical protein